MLFGISSSIKGSYTLFMTSEKKILRDNLAKVIFTIELTMSILTIQGSQENFEKFNFTFNIQDTQVNPMELFFAFCRRFLVNENFELF